MKPTYGAISPEGQKMCSISVDTFGFFARCIEDLRLLANVFGLKDDGPLTDMLLKETKIAIMKTPVWHQAGPGTIAAIDKAAIILESYGAKVEEVSFPSRYEDFDMLKRMYTVVADSDAQATFLKEYRIDKSKLHPELRSIVETARIALAMRSYRKRIDTLACDLSSTALPRSIQQSLRLALLTRRRWG